MTLTAMLLARAGHRIERAAQRVVETVEQAVRAARHRREVSGLLELDERSLRDIGLMRSDVAGALAGPISEDPSVWLRNRALDRATRLRAVQGRFAPASTPLSAPSARAASR
jgi:uncharacterized protein YjiS (DUF1127 family)